MSVQKSLSARTRQPKTEAKYIERALWFESYVSKELSQLEVSPIEVVSYAISEKKKTWKASTWRQIKAALIFRYELMGTKDASDAKLLLLSQNQSGTTKKSKNSSALRKKNVSDSDLTNVLELLRKSYSSYAASLEKWISLGSLLGLRPHEWCQSSVLRLSKYDIEGKGDVINKLPYLRILNGKNSNNRAHGKYRHLCLSELTQDKILEISEFTILMSSLESTSEYDKFYSGCQKLLYRINLKIKQKFGTQVQIYSARHMFASGAKKIYSNVEVAALMGHANDITASVHYGLKKKGSGCVVPSPLADEVAKVKQKKINYIPTINSTSKKEKKLTLKTTSNIDNQNT